MKKLLSFILLSVLLISCTENSRVRKFGGTGDIKLNPNQKLVNLEWKGDQLWILTKKMRSDETPETYSFKDYSKYGIIEGEYVIIETK